MTIAPAHPHHPWAFPVGILGNAVSVMVYLAPMPTFYRVYKKKSTEGFQSIPYVVALFSSMLWIYYALLKSDAFLLITINSFGCLIETFYLTVFIVYASKEARILTVKLLVLLNFGLFGSIFLLSMLLAKGSTRTKIVGWVCVGISACVFAAPLSIIRLVIRTKSVEFMPFYLSFFLTLSAILWCSYGLLLNDLYIAVPNVPGFLFGVVQMLLYIIYKNIKKAKGGEKLDHYTSGNTSTSTNGDEHVIGMSSIGKIDLNSIDLQQIVLVDQNMHQQNCTDGENQKQGEP